MKTKFDWGTTIKPVKETIKKAQIIKCGNYTISLGKSKNGDLALVRAGRRSIEFWSADFWEVLSKYKRYYDQIPSSK